MMAFTLKKNAQEVADFFLLTYTSPVNGVLFILVLVLSFSLVWKVIHVVLEKRREKPSDRWRKRYDANLKKHHRSF